MNVDDIFQLWTEDVEIDKTELGDEAIKIPKLHNKYFQIYIKEKLLLRKFDSEMKQLKLDKYEFYTQGHTEETRSKMWELPAKGLILKTDIPMYMDADPDIVKLSLKIGLQQEKVDFLDSIIKSLNSRGFNIKAAIDWHKFTMGA